MSPPRPRLLCAAFSHRCGRGRSRGGHRRARRSTRGARRGIPLLFPVPKQIFAHLAVRLVLLHGEVNHCRWKVPSVTLHLVAPHVSNRVLRKFPDEGRRYLVENCGNVPPQTVESKIAPFSELLLEPRPNPFNEVEFAVVPGVKVNEMATVFHRLSSPFTLGGKIGLSSEQFASRLQAKSVIPEVTFHENALDSFLQYGAVLSNKRHGLGNADLDTVIGEDVVSVANNCPILGASVAEVEDRRVQAVRRASVVVARVVK